MRVGGVAMHDIDPFASVRGMHSLQSDKGERLQIVRPQSRWRDHDGVKNVDAVYSVVERLARTFIQRFTFCFARARESAIDCDAQSR